MVTSYYFVNGDCENYIKTLACWMTKTLFKYAYDPNIYQTIIAYGTEGYFYAYTSFYEIHLRLSNVHY